MMTRHYLTLHYIIVVVTSVLKSPQTKFGTYSISRQNIGSGTDSHSYEITKPAHAEVCVCVSVCKGVHVHKLHATLCVYCKYGTLYICNIYTCAVHTKINGHAWVNQKIKEYKCTCACVRMCVCMHVHMCTVSMCACVYQYMYVPSCMYVRMYTIFESCSRLFMYHYFDNRVN